MALWNGLSQAATVAQLVGADVGGLISMILQAAMTARQNRKECEQLARRVFMIAELLPHIQDPEAARQLAGLGDTLRDAHELVMSCQGRSAVYQLVMAGRQAERFREVQSKIDFYLILFPVISHIGITRRLDRIYNALVQDDSPRVEPTPHPQSLSQLQMVAATNNFASDSVIGSGGYGTVYRGSLHDRFPRSLTVFGNAGEAVYLDLTNCQLLRVLDLQECNDDLRVKHLQIIYNMLHLKYLALPSSVSKLSAKMERLHCLETLDLRKTKIETLPLQIITLPHLTHLFGKIKINKLNRNKLQKFQSGKSNLQTLAGVFIDNKSGFPELLIRMTKLRKVKIWCESIRTESNYTLLSEAIDKFAKDGLDTPQAARSLSLHLNDSCHDLLPHHQGYNEDGTPKKALFLSSLKLYGRPSQFKFVESLSGLQELCLTSTSLTAGDLSLLSAIRRLLYLKLVEVHLADLEINLGDFQSLQRLCFVVEEPGFPRIQQGALPSLVSLQLLCKKLVGLCDHIQVNSFGRLQEIALDSMVNNETIRTWESEARKHHMRPRVSLFRRVDPADTRSAVKYVATDLGSSEAPMQGTPESFLWAQAHAREMPCCGVPFVRLIHSATSKLMI